jgi:prepilin peptidase CpaA
LVTETASEQAVLRVESRERIVPEMSLKLVVLIVGVATLTIAAAIWDLRERRIPNQLTLPALVLGFVYQAVFAGWPGLADAGLAFLAGFGTLFVLWLIGGGGGGDAKLMGALSVWLGFTTTLFVMMVSIGFVLLGTLGQSLWSRIQGRRSRSLFAHNEPSSRHKPTVAERQKRRVMAFAVPLALATWAVMLWQLSTS